MRGLRDFNLKNKRVLLRCDFNIPLDDKGKIEDDFRIRQTAPTIKYLIKNKAKIILMSHLGSPGGRVVEELTLTPVQEKLIDILGLSVKKTPDCIGRDTEKQVAKMKEGEILLLENLRFHRGEEANNPNFTKELAKLGDIYINDAFGVSHRAHASIVGLPKHLPSGAGLLLEKEVKVLSTVLKKPWRPLVAIIGGVKIESKIKVIKQFLEKADHLLIGGKIANAILIAKGICIGRPWPSEKVTEEIKKLNLTSTKLHLPIDAIVSPDETGKVYIRESAPGKVRKDEKLLDIGPETINIFSEIIKTAKMIIWSGPLGLFEEPLFEKGTKEVGENIIRNHRAYRIVGGGDTLFALSKFGLREKFDHVSTGGGAMLQFLSGEEFPGLEVLKSK
jgi:phosphoglycerate kinase